MNSTIAFIKRHPLVTFFIFTYIFSWWSWPILGDQNPTGPLLAALIVVPIIGGKVGLKAWASRIVRWRVGLHWYATQLAAWVDIPSNFLLFLILVGIGEETGWMAFAAVLLLRRHPFITAWLILSTIRVFWHLPLMFSGDLSWVLGIGGNIAFQFLMLWLFQHTGVWFLAAIWHAMLNATGGKFFFQMVQGEDQARLGLLMTAGYILTATVVFLVDRRNLERPPPQPEVVAEPVAGI